MPTIPTSPENIVKASLTCVNRPTAFIYKKYEPKTNKQPGGKPEIQTALTTMPCVNNPTVTTYRIHVPESKGREEIELSNDEECKDKPSKKVTTVPDTGSKDGDRDNTRDRPPNVGLSAGTSGGSEQSKAPGLNANGPLGQERDGSQPNIKEPNEEQNLTGGPQASAGNNKQPGPDINIPSGQTTGGSQPSTASESKLTLLWIMLGLGGGVVVIAIIVYFVVKRN